MSPLSRLAVDLPVQPPSRSASPVASEPFMRFYVGVHHPSMGWPLTLRGFRVCLSANVLVGRVGDIPFVGCSEPWLLDSGAFTQVTRHGRFLQAPHTYAALVRRYAATGLVAAATQDYMTEPAALRATGLTVRDHQRLTVERYDAIADAGTDGVYLMPVLQGWTPDDYRRCLEDYGDRIGTGAWLASARCASARAIPRRSARSSRRFCETGPTFAFTGLASRRPRC